MNRESENARTMRENEKSNEGGREFGRVHQPSQTQEATNTHGLADDVGKDNEPRQQVPGPRQEGRHPGSGTQQDRPPDTSNGSRRERHAPKKAA